MKRNPVLKICVFFATFSISLPSFSSTYYVSTAGNDLNPGTISSPWRNINKAAAVMTAGDTVYVREGTYAIRLGHEISPSHSGKPGRYITFSNYNGEKVVLDGMAARVKRPFKLYSGATKRGELAYVRIRGLTIQNFSYGGIEARGNTHHIEILDCRIKGVAYMMRKSAIRLRGVHDVIIAGTIITNGHKGIELNDDVYNVQIIDCLIYDMNQYRKSRKIHLEADGINTAGSNLHDVIIDGCEVYDCQDDGIDLRGRHFTIKHCVAHDISNPWPGHKDDGHGYKVYALDDSALPGKYHAEFIRCVSYNNSREGFRFSSITADTHGRPPADVKKFRMLNCTAAGDDYGLLLVNEGTHPMSFIIKNTILSSGKRAWKITGKHVKLARHNTSVPSLSRRIMLDSDYNLYYTGGRYSPIYCLGSLYSDGEINRRVWHSETGCGAHAMSGNPRFINARGGDYRLSGGSPCIDAGTDIGLPYAGNSPDIGAFESGTLKITSPVNYLKKGVCWISVPVQPVNPGPYSVFSGLDTRANSVYHNLSRYDTAAASEVVYPTYQSDPVRFGDIVPGAAYKLILEADNDPITVSGIELKNNCVLEIAGSGNRYFYFGNPFKEAIFLEDCRIDNGTAIKAVGEAISAGWIKACIKRFNPFTQTWEEVGAALEPWNVYSINVHSPGILKLIIPYSPLRQSGLSTSESLYSRPIGSLKRNHFPG